MVKVCVSRCSPSTVTSAWNSSPGAIPSKIARPSASVFSVRLRRSPPAFLMMALTSAPATALAGIWRATRTLTVPAGMPLSGSGRPRSRAGWACPAAPAAIIGWARAVAATGEATQRGRDQDDASLAPHFLQN